MSFFNRNKWREDSFQLSLVETELSLGEELKGTVRLKSDVEFDVEKIWVRLRCEENAGKDHAILYDNDDLDLSDAIHVSAEYDKAFPFVLKLPSVGKETYHSFHQKIQWLVEAYIKVKGTEYAIPAKGGGQIHVTKRIAPPMPAKETKVVQSLKEKNVPFNNEEKELLRGKLSGISDKPPIILTNKRISTPTETTMLSDVLEAYTQRKGGFSSLSKLVLRLKNGTLKEYSIAIAKENMPSQASTALNLLSGWYSSTEADLANGSKNTIDRWVNLINNTLMAKEKVQIILDFSALKDVMSKGGIVMTSYKCPECNAKLDLPETGKVLICKYCGTPIKPVDIFEKVKSLIQ